MLLLVAVSLTIPHPFVGKISKSKFRQLAEQATRGAALAVFAAVFVIAASLVFLIRASENQIYILIPWLIAYCCMC